MDYSVIKLEKRDSVGFIRLNAPKKYNSIDITMASEIIDALDICEEDDEIKVIVITGNGKAFCAGGDIGFSTNILADRMNRLRRFLSLRALWLLK